MVPCGDGLLIPNIAKNCLSTTINSFTNKLTKYPNVNCLEVLVQLQLKIDITKQVKMFFTWTTYQTNYLMFIFLFSVTVLCSISKMKVDILLLRRHTLFLLCFPQNSSWIICTMVLPGVETRLNSKIECAGPLSMKHLKIFILLTTKHHWNISNHQLNKWKQHTC